MKKSKSNPLPPMKLTSAESDAVSSALDFMLHYDEYTYNNTKFDFNDVSNAAWSADSGEIQGKRREIHAVAAAIELSLHCLANDPDAVEQVNNVLPEIESDLKEAVPVLESLRSRVAAYKAKAANRK